jgi:hypothetical protein
LRTNGENKSNNKTTVRILCNAEQSGTCLQSKQNDSAVHSDAGYCNEKESRRQAGGHFFLSNDNKFPPYNGAILTIATIIKAVMSSAAEAVLGALYLNAKRGGIFMTNTCQNGQPTTTNLNPNQQLNGRGSN